MAKKKAHEKRQVPDIVVAGIRGRDYTYPAWRYHEWHEPIIVEDTDQDLKAKEHGYFEAQANLTSVRYLFNWRFDLEDMTARQLAQFAKDNFELDLPVEAGKEKLFKCIWRLHVADPRNKDSVVLMAQSTRMRYDATVDYIKQVAEFGNIPKNCIVEVTKEEFWA